VEEDVRGEEMGAWRSGRLDIFWSAVMLLACRYCKGFEVGEEDILLVRRGSFVCGFLVEVLDSAGTVVGGASLTILE